MFHLRVVNRRGVELLGVYPTLRKAKAAALDYVDGDGYWGDYIEVVEVEGEGADRFTHLPCWSMAA